MVTRLLAQEISISSIASTSTEEGCSQWQPPFQRRRIYREAKTRPSQVPEYSSPASYLRSGAACYNVLDCPNGMSRTKQAFLHSKLMSRRNLQYGANKQQSRWLMNSPAGRYRLVLKNPCHPRWRDFSSAPDRVLNGPPNCTSQLVTSWTVL